LFERAWLDLLLAAWRRQVGRSVAVGFASLPSQQTWQHLNRGRGRAYMSEEGGEKIAIGCRDRKLG
jgi:hypothetical protein